MGASYFRMPELEKQTSLPEACVLHLKETNLGAHICPPIVQPQTPWIKGRMWPTEDYLHHSNEVYNTLLNNYRTQCDQSEYTI